MNILDPFIISRIAAVMVLIFLIVIRVYAKQKNSDFYHQNQNMINGIFWFLFVGFLILGVLAPLITGCELIGAKNSGGPHSVTCYHKGIVPDVWNHIIIYGSYALVALGALCVLIARKMK